MPRKDKFRAGLNQHHRQTKRYLAKRQRSGNRASSGDPSFGNWELPLILISILLAGFIAAIF